MSVTVERRDRIGFVTMRRPPNNFFDAAVIRAIADAYAELQADRECRVVVLRSEGKHFCAGNDYAARESAAPQGPDDLFDQAVRLFETTKPVVAQIQGAAIGGGLGLALTADFRIAASESRWSTAFARMGNHPGFGITALLPRIVGHQASLRLLYTAERIGGDEARRIGLCDELVPLQNLESACLQFAARIAESAPLAVMAIKETLRGGLQEEFATVTKRERLLQQRLEQTADFREGVAAMASRRTPVFEGR
jgi:enoyl-CoA hydratase/carnithine racemase